MRLAEFILSNIELILMDWEVFARSLSAGANMEKLALRDSAEDILLATVRDMRTPQSLSEQSAKSKGRGGEEAASVELNSVSDQHAVARWESGFNLAEVISEYRALRASVLRLWRESEPDPDERDLDDLTRFNESIDQSLTKAVSGYSKRVDQSREMFLGILGHDLRNPLGAISLLAQVLARTPCDDPDDVRETAAQITMSAAVMTRMISDLLDFTRTRLGPGIPISPREMDLAELCRELLREYQAGHPDRAIRFRADDGDAHGEWDSERLRQAISNLVVNAIHHGAPEAPVELALSGQSPDAVTLTVHNQGNPIPPEELPKIFDPMLRGVRGGGGPGSKSSQGRAGSMGLGLHIVRDIARAHGGTIDVTSSESTGTTFTLHLPRHRRRSDQ